MTEPELCPCGTSLPFNQCCGPIIDGSKQAPSPEALMRARYTAFATGKVDFIISSHAEETREEVVREEVEVWSTQSEWLGLQVLGTQAGGDEDTEGLVDFVAKYKLKGLTTQHRERALFKKIDGKWLFFDGGEIPAEIKQKAPLKWVGGKKNKKKR